MRIRPDRERDPAACHEPPHNWKDEQGDRIGDRRPAKALPGLRQVGAGDAQQQPTVATLIETSSHSEPRGRGESGWRARNWQVYRARLDARLRGDDRPRAGASTSREPRGGTMPTRTLTPARRRSRRPDRRPRQRVPGRASASRCGAGTGQAHRTASTPTISSPRAPGTASRSARPRPARSSSPSNPTPRRLVRGGHRHRGGHPGDNVVSLIKDDQPLLVPVGGEIRHHAEPGSPLLARRIGRRCASSKPDQARGRGAATVFDPEQSDHVSPYEVSRGTSRRAFGAADVVLEGEYRVGHRSSCTSRTSDDRRARRGRGHRHPWSMHARTTSTGAQAGAEAQLRAGAGDPGGDRRRLRRKEEYPSMLALHASLLALKARRPIG